jgi:hypothetical protein
VDKLRGDELKRAIRRLGIKWPGDGGYEHGTEVWIGGSNKVVRLVEKLDDLGQYKTEEGGTYTERRVGTVITQDYRPPKVKAEVTPEQNTLYRKMRGMIVAYLLKHKQAPRILHISFRDLEQMMREEPSLENTGIGLDISLVPNGQPMSVDRRVI